MGNRPQALGTEPPHDSHHRSLHQTPAVRGAAPTIGGAANVSAAHTCGFAFVPRPKVVVVSSTAGIAKSLAPSTTGVKVPTRDIGAAMTTVAGHLANSITRSTVKLLPLDKVLGSFVALLNPRSPEGVDSFAPVLDFGEDLVRIAGTEVLALKLVARLRQARIEGDGEGLSATAYASLPNLTSYQKEKEGGGNDPHGARVFRFVARLTIL